MRNAEKDLNGTEPEKREDVPADVKEQVDIYEEEPVSRPEEVHEAPAAEKSSGVLNNVKGVVTSGLDQFHELEEIAISNVKNVSTNTVRNATKLGMRLYDTIDVLVGISFILMGAWTLHDTIDYTGIDALSWESWVVTYVFITSGLVMIFNPRRTFNSSIGIYALAISTTKALTSWDDMSTDVDILFYYYFIMFLFAINLSVSGWSYLRNRPRGTVGMTLNASIVVISNLVMIVYYMRFEGMTMAQILDESPTLGVETFLYVVFLIMLDSDSARSLNTKVRLSRSTDAIRRSKTVSDASYVFIENARVACDPTYEMWSPVHDGGPVERECVIEAQSKKGRTYILAQKWKDVKNIQLTVSDHIEGSIIKAARIDVIRIYMENEKSMVIEGEDHSRIRLQVKIPLEDYVIGVSEGATV